MITSHNNRYTLVHFAVFPFTGWERDSKRAVLEMLVRPGQ